MPRLPLRIALGFLALAAPALASVPAQAASTCSSLSVAAPRTTTDPVAFQDDSSMLVRPTVAIADLKVSIRRGAMTIATGA